MNDVMIAERAEIENEVNPIIAAAQNLVVRDATSYTAAMELGKTISAKIKWIEGKLAKGKKAAHESWQEWVKLEREGIGPLETIKKLISGRAYTWQKAEEERKRKEAEEALRLAEEEAAKKREIEEEARLAAAERLSKEGMQEQAEEMLETPSEVEVEEVAAPAPKVTVQGASTRENWVGEVIDENLIPPEYTTPDLVKLNRATKMLKGETRIPGWKVRDKGTVAFRT